MLTELLFLNKIYEKKQFRMYNVITVQYKRITFCVLFYSAGNYNAKTTKISVNRTFSYSMHHRLRITLCRKINFICSFSVNVKQIPSRRIKHLLLNSVISIIFFGQYWSNDWFGNPWYYIILDLTFILSYYTLAKDTQ